MNDMTAFNPSPVAMAASAAVNAEAQRAIAQVQAQMMIARMNPRNVLQAREDILKSCTRIRLAQSATYEYKRGGEPVTGPTIRLAEAIAQAWGNIDFGFTELESSPESSTVMAYCVDMQTGTRRSLTFTVPQVRHTRKGVTPLTDPRDRYENLANQAQRRVRMCILACIPGDIVEDALEQCNTTLATKFEVTTDTIAKMVRLYEKYGVKKAQLEQYVQQRIDTITPAQMARLHKILTGLRDGMSKPEDFFDMDEPQSAASDLNDIAKQKTSGKATPPKATAKKQDAPAPADASDDDPEPDADAEEKPAANYESVKAAIQNASSLEKLREARQLISMLTDPGEKDELDEMAAELMGEM